MKRLSIFLTIVTLILMMSSCIGDYKQQKYVDIGTNETGFLIPLEQGTKDGQKVLKSVEYLEQKKVATKRVYIEQKEISTGRMWYDYKYIPTDTVIVVHRSPVTREWSREPGTGTSSQNQVLNVESKESIGFDVPVNSTASVLEEDASVFLYHFGGQTVEYVMDHNVRPYILDVLTTEFGKRSLDECQLERKTAYDSMKVKTTRFFKQYGLTIVNIGAAGEFTYTDPSIQAAINTKFTSEMKITAASNEAIAAEKFAKAAESIKKQKELDADVHIKLALADAIREGKLTWPGTLVIGKDANLMDIWGAKNLSSQTKQ
jgi:hypothetical protein